MKRRLLWNIAKTINLKKIWWKKEEEMCVYRKEAKERQMIE